MTVLQSFLLAVLGLLLSSPAVVIGAMLISPLMSPILGLGFSLALFDFAEMRRALVALAIGSAAAVLFTALIVIASVIWVPLGVLIESAFDHLFTYTTRELDDLQHVQKLHEAIERNIRLKRPDAARNAVRKLLANTDAVIQSR